jgi:hypothetical protein
MKLNSAQLKATKTIPTKEIAANSCLLVQLHHGACTLHASRVIDDLLVGQRVGSRSFIFRSSPAVAPPRWVQEH